LNNIIVYELLLAGIMFPDPSISAAISATRLLFTAYNGYQKGKLIDSDESLRTEVQGRIDRLRIQIDMLYTKAHRNKQRNLRSSLQDIIEICDQFTSDARFGLSHSTNSKHAAAAKMNKKSLKVLIEHDFNTLDKLEICKNHIENLTNLIETDSEESDLNTISREIRKILVKSKEYFSQRKLIMYGYLDTQ
tara:strand:+ start:34 stop:606 length:573 start_codon:yes stop_codon:yes gene_type:complete